MINDQQRKAFELWAILTNYNVETYPNGMYSSRDTRLAEETWRSAQAVKELKFERDALGFLSAKTPFGEYVVLFAGGLFGGYELCSDGGPDRISIVVETEAKAIEAANEDFRKRVLSGLVHGGV